ncbi:MAG: fibronectin type III domain-containing protein [Planctomycetes bacterium]|nr:fibronectin type III domain-containing protein [Planctomycetota bacterium]
MTVVPGPASASVAWTTVPGATGYVVYWCEGADLLGPVSTSPEQFALGFVVTGLLPGGTYCFAVAAVHDGAVGERSDEVLATLPPGVPNTISAVATDTAIVVEWTVVEGATSYEVYRSTDPALTPESGELVATATPPYTDTSVLRGTMYYYVVVTIGSGGRSDPSSVVAAEVEVVVDAPTGLTVVVPEEAPGTLLLTWSPPLSGVPDSYNLYWDVEPVVDTTANVIVGATSPYTHSDLLGRTTYYYRVTAVVGGVESALSAQVSAMPRGGAGGGGAGGGHEEGYGNNLSLPVIFADGYGVLGARLLGTEPPWLDVASGLRPTPADVTTPFPFMDLTTAVELNGTTIYPQKTASTWQADWRDGSKPTVEGGDTSQRVVVDWGDNLRSASITTRSVVRVETTLYQDVADDPMTAFNMTLLGGSGQTESWGTDGTTVGSPRRHVFAVNARLRIEKLLAPGGAPDPAVPALEIAVADGFESSAEGGVAILQPSAVVSGGGGGGGMGARYGAEVNVSGKLVYGYVWSLRTSAVPETSRAGWWRATFALDPDVSIGGATVPNNTFLVAVDPADTTASVDVDANTTSIEFEVR